MAKCEKCGQEYPDGTEHVCTLVEEKKTKETTAAEKENKESSEQKEAPAETPQQ